MEEFTPKYIIAVAEQLSFVSAFLEGISATILVTIVVFTSQKSRSAGLSLRQRWLPVAY